MASDALIGILTGLGTAHRERQRNIFDQEVERRGKYEKFLTDAAANPQYRPEAQQQFTQLLQTLYQTPAEKKLPKDFERQIADAVTSVEGSMDLAQSSSQTMQATTPGRPAGSMSVPVPETPGVGMEPLPPGVQGPQQPMRP